MTTSIDLAALRDWEIGAPEPDPNTDGAFDASDPDGFDPDEPRLVFPDMDAAIRYMEGPDVEPDADEPAFADTLPALPAPWRMSIEALDSWVAYYRTRLRGLGRGCGALTPTEETHRAEVEGQVNSRHEARRHSSFPR